jgi:Leucine-rich repeat (LRR) protein
MEDNASIILSDSGLIELPILSDNLQIKELFVDYNQISLLWPEAFPPNLERFDAAFNFITSDGLPNVWPDSIRDINIDYNNICDTDDVSSWPLALESLKMSNNPLKKIPRHLPQSLRRLRLRNTSVQIIEYLPAELEELDCYSSKVNNIYTLPQNLLRCFLAKNNLTILPEPKFWPQRLKVLDLAFNYLTEFPEGLPDSIEHLNLANNYIKVVPQRIPASCKTLILRKNSIREVKLELLPGQRLLVLSLANNLLTTLPEVIERSTYEEIQQYDVSQNFLELEHCVCAQKIQKWFKACIIRCILRTRKRTVTLREELLEVAMHPDRYGNF